VEQVHAVFNEATHTVMYPVVPLYDDHTNVSVVVVAVAAVLVSLC
jgi:hypothetical protein